MANMMPGLVVRLRVNPKDCMSVVDVVRIAKVGSKDMSFDAMVSLALSSLLEGYRQIGAIPTRDGFEYSEVMGDVITKGRNKRKLEITKVVHQAAANGQVPGIIPPLAEHSEVPSPQPSASTTEKVWGDLFAPVPQEVKDELAELWEERAVGRLSRDKEERYQELYKVVYPEG